MPDQVFTITQVQKSGCALAQKKAVLWPLFSRRSMRDHEVIQDVVKLIAAWRKRVSALKIEKWHDVLAEGKVQFTRNCPPTMVFSTTTQTVRVCNRNHICPWCYSRYVGELYEKLATFLPNRGAYKFPKFKLVEISNNRIAPLDEIKNHLGAFFTLWQKSPKNVIKLLNPQGGYYNTAIAPLTLDGKQAVWKFQYHVLGMLPMTGVVPGQLNDGSRKIKVTDVRSKKQLVNILGRVCRYPTGLMWGDPTMTVQALNARYKLHCNSLVGCFRNCLRGLNGSTDET